MRLVQSGPRNAKLMLVGEAPGRNEAEKGIPFVGAAGEDLNRYLGNVGIVRDDCFVTNVCHERPPDNDFDYFLKPKPRIELLQGLIQLKKDIAEIKPNLVVALGDVPLRFLTNKHGISKYRHSILESSLVKGQKVIPTIHPAAVFRQYELKALVALDMKLIVEEMKFPQIVLPMRDIRIWEGNETDHTWAERMFSADWLSVDIETSPSPTRHELICCGFSDTPNRALVVPASAPGGDAIIRRLLSGPARKCGQNFGQYDLTVLEDNGYEVRNFAWDIMYSHHALLMEAASGGDEVKSLRGKAGPKSPMGKGLGFQVSIYTKEPFYKDDGKLWKLSGDVKQFYIYNGKDCCVTHEIRSVHDRELDQFGTRCAFEHEMNILPLLRQMSRRGVKIDLEARAAMTEKVEKELERLQGFLDHSAGKALNVSSAKDIHTLLYDTLKLPPKLHKDTRRPTANKDAIIELAAKYNHPVLATILEIRKRRTLLERYLTSGVDPDGRMRCLFDPSGTRTGRLASRANIYGSGTNLQNIPPWIRRMFVADPGKVLFYVDLSQAEARVVAWLARCPSLIELFESGRDIHYENSIRFFGFYDDEHRITVKRVVHGSNYGEGPDRIIAVAAADGLRLKREDVVRGQDFYFTTYPEIKTNWWEDVKRDLRSSRTLETPLGWKRQFFGRWDSVKFINEGLAFQPQCTVGILAELGMLSASRVPDAEILLNEHDAVLGQCDTELADRTVPNIVRAMEIPVTIHGRTLTIPAEAKVGRNWAEASDENPDGLKKWKVT